MHGNRWNYIILQCRMTRNTMIGTAQTNFSGFLPIICTTNKGKEKGVAISGHTHTKYAIHRSKKIPKLLWHHYIHLYFWTGMRIARDDRTALEHVLRIPILFHRQVFSRSWRPRELFPEPDKDVFHHHVILIRYPVLPATSIWNSRPSRQDE